MCRNSTVQTLRKTSRDMASVYYTFQLFGAFSSCINWGRAMIQFRDIATRQNWAIANSFQTLKQKNRKESKQ